jgi:hypothetical protein
MAAIDYFPKEFPMRLFWLCLLLFTAPLFSAQTVHRWIDAQGNVHFSDQPSEQHPSEVIEVNPPAPSSTPLTSSSQPEIADSAAAANAERPTGPLLTIESPANGEIVRENSGLVMIKANLSPLPLGQFKMNVLLDGQLKGDASNTLIVELENVDRGMHQLELQVIDENGKLLASSSKTTFYLFRVSVQSQPNNRPTPKVNGA